MKKMRREAEGAAVDMAVPTEAAYREAYAFARRLFDLAPWTFMCERQVLAVRPKSGRTRFVMVMGEMGEHRAVSVYPDYPNCASLMLMPPERDESTLMDIMFSLSQLQLAFVSKAALFEGEREAIAASGAAFKNGRWPNLQSFVPGYLPARMGAGELAVYMEYVTALTEFLAAGHSVRTVGDVGHPVTTWSEGEDGVWRRSEEVYGWVDDGACAGLDRGTVEAVRALPVADATFEFGSFLLPCGDAYGWRRKCGRVAMMLDQKSRYLFKADFVQVDDGDVWDVSHTLLSFCKMMLSCKRRPARMYGHDFSLKPVWEEFCGMIGAGAEPVGGEAISDCYQGLADMMSGLGG